MRFRNVVFAVACLVAAVALCLGFAHAEAPQGAGVPAPAAKSKMAAGAPVRANLAQLMRGILFPNSNVIFYAQSNDPTAVKPAADPTMATDPLTGSFRGWAAVENSSLALSEAANLLTIPGRLCSNGLPVPLKNADWPKLVQGLRDAGIVAYKAAQTKDQDKMLDAADTVTTACMNCHVRYRDKTENVADRCK